MKNLLLFLMIALMAVIFLFVQRGIQLKADKLSEYSELEDKDLDYEMKHKDSDWFKAMNEPNADYFAVKESFDKYFTNHKWEKSRPRATGEKWLRKNIFYLDKNGKVQDEPPFDYSLAAKVPAATAPPGVTTRDVGTWHMLGPVNSIHVGGPKGNHGGYVYMNRIDPTDPQKMFASFLTGGLWVTTDGGTSWTLTDVNLPNAHYIDLDVCTSSPSVVYAISSSHSILIKSVDGGLNWSLTSMTDANYPGQKFYDLAVSPTDPNVVIARIGDKIYRTADGGTTWSSIVTSLANYPIWDCSNQSEMLDWSTTDNNVVYFLSHTGNMCSVYRSADAGATFSNITTITLDPLATGQVIGWAKLFLPSNNATDIYVAIGTGDSPYQHRSVQFYKLNNTTGAEILKRVNMLEPPNPLHHGDIVMDRTNESRLFYGTYGTGYTHYSTDNGVSFTITTNDAHFDIRSVDMIDNRILTGSDGGATLSTDGGISHSNLTLTNTISSHELWGFGAAFKSELVASGNNHGPHMIREDGPDYEWYSATDADAGNTDVNPLDDRYIYGGNGYSNKRYTRTGPGAFVIDLLGFAPGGYLYFNNLEFHPNLYFTLINYNGSSNNLIRSDDNGLTISTVHTFPAQVARNKIYFQDTDIMYVLAGTSNGTLWKTTDGGTNWTDVTPSLAESSNQVNISDIALSDVNPDHVWITYSGVQTDCKVLSTTDGGSSWSPVGTPATLTSQPLSRMVYQRGSDGGIYVGTMNSGVFYKNNTLPDWVSIGNLPAMDVRNMFINYNLGKLRIGTSRGAWEHDLYETSPPMAQISANTNKVVCTEADEIQFRDYSTVRNASATWAWSFPGGTPSTSSLENPVVSYLGAANGSSYDVSLTVTDAFGSSTQTLNDFIQVESGACAIDTIPGNLLTLTDPGDFAVQNNALDISTDTMTLSCWIKPNGAQNGFAGIIFSASGNMSGNGCGLNFTQNGNQLGYHWNGGQWFWNGGPTVPLDVWSHVSMVVTPSSTTLYLDGVPYTNNVANDTAAFNAPFKFGIYKSNTARNFKGLMDEVCIYNRALSTAEIRALMNLTRNNPNAGSMPGTDPSLVSYYQFNEGAGVPSYDKVSGLHANLSGNATKTATSTAPVGGGASNTMAVTSGDPTTFTGTGCIITFPGSGTYPDGDVVVSKLNVAPDQNPGFGPIPPDEYWIIRNYGTNAAFSTLESIQFAGLSGVNDGSPGQYSLYKRGSNADGNTWGTAIDAGDAATTTSITFSTGNSISSFSQFAINDGTVLPVELLNFGVELVKDKQVNVYWKTASEINNDRFEIEWSQNAKEFKKIGEVASLSNTSYETIKYSFLHEDPARGVNYYRLKQIDLDGTYSYSNIRSIALEELATEFVIFPNPISSDRVLNIRTINTSSYRFTIYNAKGAKVFKGDYEGDTEVKLPSLNTGMYFYRIETDKKLINGKIEVID